MKQELRAEDAIDELFSLYGNDVFRFALYTLHDEEESLDVVQETFYRAFLSWNYFRHEASPKTWLLRIARNYMCDLLRKKKSTKEKTYALRCMTNAQTELGSTIELMDVIARLPAKYRQVIILRVIQDQSVAETAQTLGWTESKVRLTQHRAAKKLREYLQESGLGKGGYAHGN